MLALPRGPTMCLRRQRAVLEAATLSTRLLQPTTNCSMLCAGLVLLIMTATSTVCTTVRCGMRLELYTLRLAVRPSVAAPGAGC